MSKDFRAPPAAQAVHRAAPPLGPDRFMARWGVFLAGGIIALAALAAYHNSFSGPFILDDRFAITDNPSIRHLSSALSPPPSSTSGGRPLLNLTFALNYALGGLNVEGYHALNLLIHALAGLTLFGLVRRTLCEHPTSNLQRPTSKSNNSLLELRRTGPALLEPSFGKDATVLALAVAVLWVVHPLQTEAVTYISQRAESLMGLFYLLTLYCFVRGTEGKRYEAGGGRPDRPHASHLRPPASVLWLLTSVLCCLLGGLSKETIVTAPVIVFLYDRTFVAGTFREAWRRRWRYYFGLAGTWLLLFAGMALGLHHLKNVGFGQNATCWEYALTSCRSVVLYLKLAVWPHPLVLDYGNDVVHDAAAVLPDGLILIVLIAAAATALWRWPVVGFVGAWVFLILSPTSSIVPVAGQPAAEHRMYLPLAAIIAAAALGLHRWTGRRSLIIFVTAAAALCWLTIERNQDYGSELGIYKDTVTKCPENARARYNLGVILTGLGRSQEAIAEYETALRLNPDYAEAHNNLGLALAGIPGRLPEAISHYEAALRLNPDYADAHNGLGVALAKIPGRLPEAIAHYEAALQLDPDSAKAHNNLGAALAKIPGRLPDAIAHYEAALRIDPGFAEAHDNLGLALATIPGKLPDAILHFEAALRTKPDYADAHYNLGVALVRIPGRLPEAITHFEAALKINPNSVGARYNLGTVLLQQGHYSAACEQYEAVLKLKPDLVEGYVSLGMALLKMGRSNDAAAEFETALQMRPGYPPAQHYLELAQKMSNAPPAP